MTQQTGQRAGNQLWMQRGSLSQDESTEQELEQEDSWGKDSPSRSEHNICPRGAWNSLERAPRVCVCVCVFNEDCTGGGGEIERRSAAVGLAQALQQIRDTRQIRRT